MVLSRAWLNFRRMEDLTAVAAGLIYAAAAIHGFQRLPGGAGVIARWTLLWPAIFLGVTMGAALFVPTLRRGLVRYVWMSFRAGFGQSPASVLAGVALLAGAAFLLYREIAGVAATGRYETNIFSAYAAGMGLLIAQAVLVRNLERLPEVRALIEEE
jgi:hypothetical protein